MIRCMFASFLLVTPLFAKDIPTFDNFNVFKNSAGQLTYVELQGVNEVERFLDAIESVDRPQPIATLIIKNFGFTKKHDEPVFERLVAFLAKHGSQLQYMRFLARPKANRYERMSDKGLLQIVSTIQKYPVRVFRWEGQKKVKKKDIVKQLIEFHSFWKQLEELSFAGTEFTSKTFFMDKVEFDALENLNLSNTKLETKQFERLLKNKSNFPELRKLNINGLFFNIRVKPVDGRFSKLEYLSMYSHNKCNLNDCFTHQKKYLEKHSGLLANLQTLYLYDKSSRNAFGYEAEKPLAPANFKVDKNIYVKYAPGVKQTGYFYHDFSSEGTFVQYSNSMGNVGWFFSSEADLQDYEKNYADTKFENVTLVSPDITRDQVGYVANKAGSFAQVKNIFLVHTSLSPSEIERLRRELRNTSVRLHIVRNSFLLEPKLPWWVPTAPVFPWPEMPKPKIPKLPNIPNF